MESLFLSLWNRSIAAGWLILVVVLLRLVLKRAPKSVRPWLWALVAARLVCPRFSESPLSLLPSAETVPQASLTMDAFSVQSGIAVFNTVVNEQLVDFYETTEVPAGHTRGVVFVCAVVWLTGMALLALWALVSFLRLRRRVEEAVPEGEAVWLSDRIDSPFLLGVFRPRIYLPVGLDPASRTYVLAHERAHIRRRDHLVKPLGLLLLAVYWFQPLVWAAYVLLCRDLELACDERVIAELDAECKKPYSAALLACSARRSGLTALAFGETGIRERVKNVLNYRKPAFWAVLACTALVITVGVCFLTDPVAGPEKEPPEGNVSFTNLGTSQPGEPKAFAAGALLYQDMALSFQPIDGSFYNPILYGGDTLTLTQGYPGPGLAITYKLADTVSMAWDNLYDYFPTLAEQEAWSGVLLTDHNDLVITARFYEKDRSHSASDTDAPQSRASVWTVQKEDRSGGQRWWLYDGYRLYALIDLDEAFPFLANGALWTYEPNHSELLPVRFDIEGGAEVYAGPDGQLFLDPRGENPWTEPLVVEEGQTVYWRPPLDGDGKPMANAGLHYSCGTEEEDHRVDEALTIRPAMDYTGLYGGVTYGVSNNWLGAASSAMYFTCLTVDPETGDLVVSTYAGGGPYQSRMRDENVGSVSGRSGPVYDMEAEQSAE